MSSEEMNDAPEEEPVPDKSKSIEEVPEEAAEKKVDEPVAAEDEPPPEPEQPEAEQETEDKEQENETKEEEPAEIEQDVADKEQERVGSEDKTADVEPEQREVLEQEEPSASEPKEELEYLTNQEPQFEGEEYETDHEVEHEEHVQDGMYEEEGEPMPEEMEKLKSEMSTRDRKVSMAAFDEEIKLDMDERQGSYVGRESKLTFSGVEIEGKRETLEKKKRGVLGSIISIRRGDPTYFDRQKAPRFQNSYKLDSDKSFNSERVTKILQEVLEEALHDLTYDQDKVPKQAKWASSAIRAKVKEQEYDRYKIICYVSIGEKLCQDVIMMLRFLWDADRDSYALYVHENMNLFAIGLCFGIYYE